MRISITYWTFFNIQYLNGSYKIRCNIYDKPINLTKESKIIPESFQDDFSLMPISVITSTTTTDLFGVSLDGFNFGTVGSLENTFPGFADQLDEQGLITNTFLNIKEIRQNRSGEYVEPGNNCNIFF